jgi:hypothetical protein
MPVRVSVSTGLPVRLELPSADHGIFDGVGVAVLEVGDDHHVLGKAWWHGECLGERSLQEVSEIERRTNDDVPVVELSSHETALVPPVEQPSRGTLGDSFELGGEAAQVFKPHPFMVACVDAQWRSQAIGQMIRVSGTGSCCS